MSKQAVRLLQLTNGNEVRHDQLAVALFDRRKSASGYMYRRWIGLMTRCEETTFSSPKSSHMLWLLYRDNIKDFKLYNYRCQNQSNTGCKENVTDADASRKILRVPGSEPEEVQTPPVYELWLPAWRLCGHAWPIRQRHRGRTVAVPRIRGVRSGPVLSRVHHLLRTRINNAYTALLPVADPELSRGGGE